MKADATPDPNFVQSLEWQLRRELRRADRFAPAQSPASRRWALMAVLLLASGLVGAAGMGAAQQVQVARRAEPVLKLMDARAQAAAKVRESAAAVLADAQASFRAGRTAEGRVSVAEARLSDAESLAARAALDLEETRLSGQPPRDELSAPLVKTRDFVSERLRLVLTARQQHLTLAEGSLKRAQTLHSAGAASIATVSAAQLAKHLAEIDVQETSARIAARQRFLAGTEDAAQVERSDLQTLADHRVLRAQERTNAAQKSMETTRLLHSAGRVSTDELRTAEEALAEVQWELTIAQSEAAILRGEDTPPR